MMGIPSGPFEVDIGMCMNAFEHANALMKGSNGSVRRRDRGFVARYIEHLIDAAPSFFRPREFDYMATVYTEEGIRALRRAYPVSTL